MAKVAHYRGLAMIALQSMSENELKILHSQISNMSEGAFIILIRSMEREFLQTIGMDYDKFFHTYKRNSISQDIIEEVEKIRKRDLRMSVSEFADRLSLTLIENNNIGRREVPKFDPRRGLSFWLERLLDQISEQEVYHAVILMKSKKDGGIISDWKLR